ncbi:MAG TPA: NADH-quinone oxidoreductase subunit A [Firmicutes bacterium]|nr:NADH-quinone oxidoreductase subunit A [Bacillota bacterium]
MDTQAVQESISTSTGLFPLFLTIFLAALLSAIVWIFATYIGPRRVSKAKLRTYECGIKPSEPAHQRHDVQFYRTGIMFLIFSMELVFLYPWALALVMSETIGQKIAALMSMVVFGVLLLVGFIYAWGKGAFEWMKPDARTD